jgi:hypothetical protein
VPNAIDLAAQNTVERTISFVSAAAASPVTIAISVPIASSAIISTVAISAPISFGTALFAHPFSWTLAIRFSAFFVKFIRLVRFVGGRFANAFAFRSFVHR